MIIYFFYFFLIYSTLDDAKNIEYKNVDAEKYIKNFKEENITDVTNNIINQNYSKNNKQNSSSINIINNIDTANFQEYPKPDYIPSITQYKINKNNDIWFAENPTIYITPNNPWIKYYASQLYIDYDGSIKYKNEKILYLKEDGTVISSMEKLFMNNYITDDELYNFPANGDMWVMPEYFLTHGMKDDCDAWSVTITSLMLSGEMSIKDDKNNNTFVKQKIPAKSVIGYMGNGRLRDVWTEYKVYDNTFITTTGFVIELGQKYTYTSFNKFEEYKSDPLFEFDDRHLNKYIKW